MIKLNLRGVGILVKASPKTVTFEMKLEDTS
jgi:hypothetical protein